MEMVNAILTIVARSILCVVTTCLVLKNLVQGVYSIHITYACISPVNYVDFTFLVGVSSGNNVTMLQFWHKVSSTVERGYCFFPQCFSKFSCDVIFMNSMLLAPYHK